MKKTLFEKIFKCRGCSSGRLIDVINLGKQPLANGFLKNPKVAEPIFPLVVCFCDNCKLTQLRHNVNRELLFNDYVYNSSVSLVFKRHFRNLARNVNQRFGPEKILDIGSNDGVLLRPFIKELGKNAVGLEPAENLAMEANKKGLKTYTGWIEDKKTVRELLRKEGKFDVITACNVFAHVSNIKGFINSVRMLLKPRGIFVIEVAYLGDLIRNGYFDTIYHEHFFYYSVKSIKNVLWENNMKIADVDFVKTHGGSIRVFAVDKDYEGNLIEDFTMNSRLRLRNALNSKIEKLITKAENLINFGAKVKDWKNDLFIKLSRLKKEYYVVIGYGAPAKGNTLLNYFGINNKLVKVILDDSKLKKGLYTPGTHIPILLPNRKTIKNAHYILILAWNFKESIIKKLRDKYDYKGQFILPIPNQRRAR